MMSFSFWGHMHQQPPNACSRGNEGKKTSQQHRRQDYVELDGRDKKKLLFKGLLNIFASNARRQTTAPH